MVKMMMKLIRERDVAQCVVETLVYTYGHFDGTNVTNYVDKYNNAMLHVGSYIVNISQ